MSPKEFDDDYIKNAKDTDIVFVYLDDHRDGRKLYVDLTCNVKDIHFTDGVFKWYLDFKRVGMEYLSFEEDITNAELQAGVDEGNFNFYSIEKENFSVMIIF